MVRCNEQVKKAMKIVCNIVFYGVALVGWMLFGFFTAVIYETFKFISE